MDDQSQLKNIDVEKRTTRGRACPVCGGKIIPSDRAVYQNAAQPEAVIKARAAAGWTAWAGTTE